MYVQTKSLTDFGVGIIISLVRLLVTFIERLAQGAGKDNGN